MTRDAIESCESPALLRVWADRIEHDRARLREELARQTNDRAIMAVRKKLERAQCAARGIKKRLRAMEVV